MTTYYDYVTGRFGLRFTAEHERDGITFTVEVDSGPIWSTAEDAHEAGHLALDYELKVVLALGQAKCKVRNAVEREANDLEAAAAQLRRSVSA